MNRLLTPGTIFVEGDSDQKILASWFPHLQFVAAGGKHNVRKRVGQTAASWGALDRDFADEMEVSTSRLPGSRLVLLNRYCIENYLLEPAMIAAVAGLLVERLPSLQPWTDPIYITQQVLHWAHELAIYAAANRLIAQWKAVIDDDFVRYLGPLPPWTREQVLTQLSIRLTKLPSALELEALLDAAYNEVSQDLLTLAGVHRWINGKVLLEEFLYPRVFNLHNFSQTRLRDELIAAGYYTIPDELTELARRWT